MDKIYDNIVFVFIVIICIVLYYGYLWHIYSKNKNQKNINNFNNNSNSINKINIFASNKDDIVSHKKLDAVPLNESEYDWKKALKEIQNQSDAARFNNDINEHFEDQDIDLN